MSWSRKIAVTGIFLLGALYVCPDCSFTMSFKLKRWTGRLLQELLGWWFISSRLQVSVWIQAPLRDVLIPGKDAFSKPAGISKSSPYLSRKTPVWLLSSVLITTQLYWSMIEMGLCVIAACLPTLRPLFAEMSAEQIINSIRSKFSMDSVSSLFAGQQRSSKNGSGYNEFSTASETHIVPKTSDENYLGVETHAMKDLEGQAPVPSGRIMKHTDISSRQSAKEQQF